MVEGSPTNSSEVKINGGETALIFQIHHVLLRSSSNARVSQGVILSLHSGSFLHPSTTICQMILISIQTNHKHSQFATTWGTGANEPYTLSLPIPPIAMLPLLTPLSHRLERLTWLCSKGSPCVNGIDEGIDSTQQAQEGQSTGQAHHTGRRI